jgi:phospholipase/carboxylesterase
MDTSHPLSRRAFVRGTLGALVAPGLLGCRSMAAVTVEGARLTARPGTPTLAPMTGVLTPLDLGAPRDGYLYVPSSYSPEAPMPLFVALHGAGGEGRSWASYPERAERHRTIVLAPDSRGATWDLVRGGFGPDVAFLDEALRHTFARCHVDPSRVALGGFSDGASYALSLGVANGDLFSHMVAFSPGFYAPGEPITGRPRVWVSHGTRDQILSYANTSGRLVPELRDAGYDVTFVSFDGDHGVPGEISESALSWFLD